NSLAGEFIERSLSVLRPGGRFLEIGKTGNWTVERARERRPDVEYHAIYLGQDEAPITRARFTELLARFEDRTLHPLPHRVFALDQAVDAYRFMAQAKHIGKIVVVHDRQKFAARAKVRADATYLITGGFGGLGLRIAQWLV